VLDRTGSLTVTPCIALSATSLWRHLSRVNADAKTGPSFRFGIPAMFGAEQRFLCPLLH
jgi:hypothetical protein